MNIRPAGDCRWLVEVVEQLNSWLTNCFDNCSCQAGRKEVVVVTADNFQRSSSPDYKLRA